MPRSLKLRPDCIPTIKSTLLRNGFPSQRILAEHLEIAQSTVSSFLNGKPVDYLNFLELCRVLGQQWQDIADLESQAFSETAAIAKVTIAIAFPPELHELAIQLQQALTPVGQAMLQPIPGSYSTVTTTGKPIS
jgi:DNA-binding Xre family transcriptional regulator